MVLLEADKRKFARLSVAPRRRWRHQCRTSATTARPCALSAVPSRNESDGEAHKATTGLSWPQRAGASPRATSLTLPSPRRRCNAHPHLHQATLTPCNIELRTSAIGWAATGANRRTWGLELSWRAKLIGPTYKLWPMDWKLELVAVPVTDVDRAKTFYVEQVGFHADHDHQVNDALRFVQLTPPGSAAPLCWIPISLRCHQARRKAW